MGNTALKARTSRVFAIKAERKRLLDVARETYKENVSDVDDLLQDLQNQYPDEGLQNIELNYSAQAGFTFVIPEETVAEKMGGELPKIFHKVVSGVAVRLDLSLTYACRARKAASCRSRALPS